MNGILACIFLPQVLRIPAIFSVAMEQLLLHTVGQPLNLKRMSQVDLQYAYDTAVDDRTRAIIKQHMN